MTSLQDEAEDSRTSAVGRKRGLEAHQDPDVSLDEDSMQRIRKRAKQDYGPLNGLESEDGMSLDVPSSLAMVEPSASNRNDQIRTSPVMEYNLTHLPQSTSWNKGVQGGLRISFGSKARDQQAGQPHPPLDHREEAEPSIYIHQDDEHSTDNDVQINVQQQEDLDMAETLSGVADAPGGEHLSILGPRLQDPANGSSPASDRNSGPMTLNFDSDTYNQLGPLHSDPILQGRKTNNDLPQFATSDGSAVESDNLILEMEEQRQNLPEIDEGETTSFKAPHNQPVTKRTPEQVYPQDISQLKLSTQLYKSESQTYSLQELRKDDKQISVEDINFHDFIPHFLRTNPTNYHLLKPKNIKAAFNKYLGLYYPSGFQQKLLNGVDPAITEVVKQAMNDMKSETSVAAQPGDDSRIAKTARVYETSKGTFQLVEILKDNKQIKVGDIAFQDFVPHFLNTNPKTFRLLKPKNVKAAFRVYLNLYYIGQTSKALKQAMGTTESVPEHFVEQVMRDIERSFSVADTKNELVPPSVTPPSPEPGTTAGKQIGATQRNFDHLQIRGSGLVGVPQGALMSSDEGPISFTPINAPRSDIPVQPDVPSQSHQNLLPRPGINRDVGNDESATTKGDHLTDPQSRASSDGSTSLMDVEIGKIEIALQQKYFPAVDGKIAGPRCLACADTDHNTLNCPALSCTLCGVSSNHSKFTCPRNQRCGKCRQKGHSAKECPEKLLASNTERGQCDICTSPDHSEADCHYIWRSFLPKPEEIRTVSGISIYCYACGSKGHYGPDCGLRKGIILSGGITWSNSNLQKYLDQNSRDRAISSGIDYSIPNRHAKTFSFKGIANDPIVLDDSDDEVPFIRPKVDSATVQRHTGQIRFKKDSWSAQERSSGNSSKIHSRNQERHVTSAFGQPRRGQDDSARYGRERSFSPPPAYRDIDQAFPVDTRYRSLDPQMPYRPNSYRASLRNLHPNLSPPYHAPLPMRDQLGDRSQGRGGRPRRGGGRGRGGAGEATPLTVESKKKKKKQKIAKTDRSGKRAH